MEGYTLGEMPWVRSAYRQIVLFSDRILYPDLIVNGLNPGEARRFEDLILEYTFSKLLYDGEEASPRVGICHLMGS